MSLFGGDDKITDENQKQFASGYNSRMSESENRTESVVAVDLGAKRGGLWMAESVGDFPPARFGGALLDMDEGEQQWAQAPRRLLRGQSRRILRRKLAKRLLRAAATSALGVSDGPAFARLLAQLANRRGFTRPGEELEREEFQAEIPVLQNLRPDDFPSGKTAAQSLAAVVRDSDRAADLLAFLRGDDIKKPERTAVKLVRDFLHEHANAELGHFPREQYLENIKADINADASVRADLQSAGVAPDEFARVVGHIANLPLRVLRRHFRERDSATGGAKGDWDPDRLRGLLSREAGRWTCESAEERDRRKRLRDAMKNPAADLLRFWRETDPAETVPPFESNANRNPPDCAALLIHPARAAARFGGETELRNIAAALREKRPELADDIAESPDALSHSARILQRALDWNGAANPPFRLRRQARPGIDRDPEARAQTRAAFAELDSALGEQRAEKLRAFAASYYNESDDAKNGARDDGDQTSPLAKCGRNPPRKSKPRIRGFLLADALQCKRDELGDISQFVDFLRSAKVGRKGLAAVCEEAADLQKEHGNEMKARRADDPEVGLIYERAESAAAVIAEHLGHDETRRARYADPFCLAQIHSHLTGGDGFAAKCERCIWENAWRRSRLDENGMRRAADLTADSVRPFDGMLGRILNAQAERVAAEKVRWLRESDSPVLPRKILLLVEQNQFKFEEDLDDLKGEPRDQAAKTRRKIRKARRQRGAEREKQFVSDKLARINEDAPNAPDGGKICPYTGEPFSGRGEIDHIVPRAESRKSVGGNAVLNGEANLIRCSAKGNRQKGDAVYGLKDLHPEYLRAVFQTADRAEVEKRIVADIFPLLENPAAFTNFANLRRDNPDAARALRHALFVPDLRPRIIAVFLRTEHRTRVNGVQKHFARKVCESIRRRLEADKDDNREKLSFEIVRVPAREVAIARRDLLPDEFQKPRDGEQSAMSHIIDAAMTFAAATGADSETARAILPDSFRVVRMVRRPPWERGSRKQRAPKRGDRKPTARKSAPARFQIFGDTLFGERFLPVLVFPDGQIKIGFAPANSVAVKHNGAELLKTLAPFLRETQTPDLPELQKQAAGEKRGYVRLSVNKRAAFSKMLVRWRDGESAVADLGPALDILDALRYTVSRKTLTGNDLENLAKTDPGQLRRSSKFALRPNLGKRFPLSGGNVVYPAFFAWRELRERWESASPELRENPPRFLRAHFLGSPNKSGGDETRNHHKRRSKFSLPVLAGNSLGSGWRIARRTPDGGVFQLVSAKEFSARGFAAEDGVADFRRPVVLREIARSNRTAPVNPGKAERDSDEVVPLGKWRDIPTENGLGVCAAALRTKKGAMNIRIALPTPALLEIARLCDRPCGHWRDLPSAVGPFPSNAGARDRIAELLNIPGELEPKWTMRKNIRLVELSGETATIEVTTADSRAGSERNRAAELRRRFNAAQPRKRR